MVRKKIVWGLMLVAMLAGVESCSKKEEVTTLYMPSEQGHLMPVMAMKGEALITFREGVDEARMKQIIKSCGGKVIYAYEGGRSFHVEVKDELRFITEAQQWGEVERASYNYVYEYKSVQVQVIDNFHDTSLYDYQRGRQGSKGKSVPAYPYFHGVYVQEAIQAAYPEGQSCQTLALDAGNKDGGISLSEAEKHVEQAFKEGEQSHSPVLINMSFGPAMYRVRLRQQKETSLPARRNNSNREDKKKYEYVRDTAGKPESTDWEMSLQDPYGNVAREWWAEQEMESIKQIISWCKIYGEGVDYIITRSAGNEHCHEYNTAVLDPLKRELENDEIGKEVMDGHILLVSAKDGYDNYYKKNYKHKEGLVASPYSNSSPCYHEWLTMTDITHLLFDGTSFSSPYLMGFIAREFDLKGYRPEDNYEQEGITVKEMVQFIKKKTKENAEATGTQGLFDVENNSVPLIKCYFFGERYTVEGQLGKIADSPYEENQGTVYYLTIAPSHFAPREGARADLVLKDVKHVQVFPDQGLELGCAVGQMVKLTGTFHRNNGNGNVVTDVYLKVESANLTCPPEQFCPNVETSVGKMIELEGVIREHEYYGMGGIFPYEGHHKYYTLETCPVQVSINEYLQKTPVRSFYLYGGMMFSRDYVNTMVRIKGKVDYNAENYDGKAGFALWVSSMNQVSKRDITQN